MSAVKKPRMIANESNIKGKIRQKDLSSGLNSISHKRQSLRNCASPLREGENEDEEDWDELNKWDIDESFAAPIPTKLKVKQQNKSAPDKQKQQQQLKTEKKKRRPHNNNKEDNTTRKNKTTAVLLPNV